MGFPGGTRVKNLPPMQKTQEIPESGRSPAEVNGNPLQYSCLKNPMDTGSWQATVHGVATSQTRLSACTCSHTHTHTHTRTASRCSQPPDRCLPWSTQQRALCSWEASCRSVTWSIVRAGRVWLWGKLKIPIGALTSIQHIRCTQAFMFPM